jgi:hypothetical protein
VSRGSHPVDSRAVRDNCYSVGVDSRDESWLCRDTRVEGVDQVRAKTYVTEQVVEISFLCCVLWSFALWLSLAYVALAIVD